MNELQPPCIPYLGIYLRDFVFILDGNPEKTENGLINFERLTLLAGLIAKIRQCQLVRYKLCPIEIIQDYLTQSLILLPEEILEAQSYKIEPRKDESAAQLTQLWSCFGSTARFIALLISLKSAYRHGDDRTESNDERERQSRSFCGEINRAISSA